MTVRSRGGDPLWAVVLGVALLLVLIGGGIGGAVYFAKARFTNGTSPEAVDAAFTADPDSAAMIEAMQESYPEDYAKIRNALSLSARQGASQAALRVQSFTMMRNAASAHLPELAQAPHAELAAFLSAEARVIESLEAEDESLCARYVMRGLGPGDILPPDVRITLSEMGTAQWRGAAAGRDQPAGRKIGATLPPRDAGPLVAAMRKQGMTDEDFEIFTTPQRWLRAEPERQCTMGKRLLKATLALPAGQSDRVGAWLIIQKRLN